VSASEGRFYRRPVSHSIAVTKLKLGLPHPGSPAKLQAWTNFMRLSLMKAALAALGRGRAQENPRLSLFFAMCGEFFGSPFRHLRS
jgi:hypothetical protein